MMTDQQNKTVAQDAQPALKVGAILRAEREARGLSVEEIAERVKFSVRQIEALEHDDAEHLPQGTFLRGFVRSYARVLGMDESRLLAATPTHTEHHFDVMDVQGGGAPLPVTGDASRRSRYLLLGALVVAILLAVFLLMRPADISLPATTGAGEEAAAESASAVSAVKTVESAKIEAGHEPNPAVKKPEAVQPLPVAKPTVVTQSVEKASAAEAGMPDTQAKPEVPLALLMKRPIHIVFLEEAWMEIIDVNGEILLSRVTQAGEEKWIGGGHRAPYQVTIGRPGAIRMYYHGKPIDLSQFNPAGVAKLVLE